MENPPKTVVLASHNPVKLRAVARGFARVFPGHPLRVESVAVPSGVASQPSSDAETLEGAENRARRAAAALPRADFWVGMEGGVEDGEHGMEAFAWVAVLAADGEAAPRWGRSRTASFALPERVAELVRGGRELGEADDLVFGRANSKQNDGAVGLLTDNVIDRAELYEPSVVLALIPFCNATLY